MKPLAVGVLISGSGSNLQAILDAIAVGSLNAEIKVVVSNKVEAYGLERARLAGVPTEVCSYKDFSAAALGTREDYDRELAERVQKYGVDLVVLAGWMHILSDAFLHVFPQQVINLHPSLLPAFPGVDAVAQAWAYGARYSGVTVHFVDSGVDTGPIILQEAIPINSTDTLETVRDRVHSCEHRLLSKAVQLYAEDKLRISGRKVEILP